ncbi:MAG TPA: nuclease-related domain-containing protein [Solirubrobacteraceae bacterium]|nr:nuclease-related domain-containing protein [Solirubrobacteraceae bacterium]
MRSPIRLHRDPRHPAPTGPPAADARERTDALLRRLPPRDWTVLADLNLRHGAEHVLVGPGGVFLLASRNPPGAGARVRDGVLWLRRDRDTRAERPGVAINRDILHAARLLQREIRTRTGRGPLVHPVVVLWCEFPQRISETDRIAFLHARDLPGWLTHRAPELDGPGCAEIVQALRAIAPPADGSPAVRHLLPRPRRPQSPSRRRAA